MESKKSGGWVGGWMDGQVGAWGGGWMGGRERAKAIYR